MDVLIVGGGLGGLTLANALKKSDARFGVTVFERDADIASRPQGYAISLNKKGGLWAMERLGFAADVARVGTEMPGFRFLTHDGKVLVTFPMPEKASPVDLLGVPRDKLRGFLLRDLDPSVVRWNTRVLGYKQTGGKVVVQLEGGGEHTADLVVACDGVRSAIRNQMIGDAMH